MSIFKKLSAAFALAATTALLPACAARSAPSVTAVCPPNPEANKAEALLSLARSSQILTVKEPIRDLYNDTVDNLTVQRAYDDGTIPYITAEDLAIAPCGPVTFTIDIVAADKAIGKHPGYFAIFDFNGVADNTDIPLLAVGFADEETTLDGNKKRYQLEPVDAKTLEQIKKAKAFALAWD